MTKTRIEIDPNVRVQHNWTFSGFENIDGPIAVGLEVEVYESEDNLVGEGQIAEIDWDKKLVFVAVDWRSLRDGPWGMIRYEGRWPDGDKVLMSRNPDTGNWTASLPQGDPR